MPLRMVGQEISLSAKRDVMRPCAAHFIDWRIERKKSLPFPIEAFIVHTWDGCKLLKNELRMIRFLRQQHPQLFSTVFNWWRWHDNRVGMLELEVQTSVTCTNARSLINFKYDTFEADRSAMSSWYMDPSRVPMRSWQLSACTLSDTTPPSTLVSSSCFHTMSAPTIWKNTSRAGGVKRRWHRRVTFRSCASFSA